MAQIRVLIADDHREVLSALLSVLEDDQRFRVVGTAATGDEACRIVRGGGVDVVLLDVNMPGGGAAAATAMMSLRPQPVVVAISAESGSGAVADMVRAGATGYLVKGCAGEALPDLVARCARGEVMLATPAASTALRTVLEDRPAGTKEPSAPARSGSGTERHHVAGS